MGKYVFFILEHDIFEIRDYEFDELESLNLPLGQKIRFINMCTDIINGIENEIKITTQMTESLKNFLIMVSKTTKKDSKWFDSCLQKLSEHKIFTIETLVEVPFKYWDSIKFNSIGLKKELKILISENFQTTYDTSASEYVILKQLLQSSEKSEVFSKLKLLIDVANIVSDFFPKHISLNLKKSENSYNEQATTSSESKTTWYITCPLQSTQQEEEEVDIKIPNEVLKQCS